MKGTRPLYFNFTASPSLTRDPTLGTSPYPKQFFFWATSQSAKQDHTRRPTRADEDIHEDLVGDRGIPGRRASQGRPHRRHNNQNQCRAQTHGAFWGRFIILLDHFRVKVISIKPCINLDFLCICPDFLCICPDFLYLRPKLAYVHQSQV